MRIGENVRSALVEPSRDPAEIASWLRPPRMRRGRKLVQHEGSVRRGLVTALGDVACLSKLMFRLARDPRVSRLDKLLVASAAVYLVTPNDLIPDWIPVVGQLDDLLVVVYSLHRLFIRTDPEILLEHWDGDAATLENLLGGIERLRGVLARPRLLAPGS